MHIYNIYIYIYILYMLSKLLDGAESYLNGLYRDDGLACFENVSGPLKQIELEKTLLINLGKNFN